MNTNTKDFMKKVQNTILSHFENKEELKKEIEHYHKNFSYKYCQTMVDYGCFDCYYSQVAETMAKWFESSINDIWTFYNDDTQKLWNMYKYLICRELEHIRTNKKVYI